MATIVKVTTGARLHFGPLAAGGPAGGRFGGVGMMVTRPGYSITVRRSEQDQCQGDPSTCARVIEFLRRIRESSADSIPPVSFEILESIPLHMGLGSGTQLGLALSAALARLMGETEVAVEVLARSAGRGLRSAIGLHGFEQGGMLVDGGRIDSGRLGTLVSRIEFPAPWRLLLVMPTDAIGLSGSAEQKAFAAQSPMPQALTAELCRIALMDWLPGVIEGDFQRTSLALYEYGQLVGRFFQAAQGGVFAHSRMAELADEVRGRSLPGVAQTSWGPTVCVLCPTEATARDVCADLARDDRFSSCRLLVTSPLNLGAAIELS